ncbi:hypothetical protein ACFUJY_11355 [Streptomyces sp. NPDC057249]|uniref:hypothetical protein n=1 Tax=Streptomyces sp. NPDC057249 TaxID=3346067 RepID=UPI003631B8FE
MSLSRIVLPSGRRADLTEMRMSSTYAGFLEGYPSKPVNEMVIRRLLRQTEQAFPSTPCHVVPPRLEHPDRPAGGFGPVVALPPMACAGLFRSTPVDPGLDPALHRSSLAVIWFQSTPNVPAGEAAGPALRDLHWDELARDYEL